MSEQPTHHEAPDDTLSEYEVVARNHPCPVCGGTIFEWGIVARFTPVTFRRGFRTFRSDKTMGVKARHCLTCEHIQLFADEGLAQEQRRAGQIAYGCGFVAIIVIVSIVLSVLN